MGRPRKRHPGGRPPAFKSPNDLNEKLEQAFKYCDETKIPYNLPEIIAYLGIHEDTWKNYRDKKTGFLWPIKRAEARIEASMTRLLLQHAPGQIFYLKNKHNWKDKQEIALPEREELNPEKVEEVRHIAQQAAAQYLKEQRKGHKSVMALVK